MIVFTILLFQDKLSLQIVMINENPFFSYVPLLIVLVIIVGLCIFLYKKYPIDSDSLFIFNRDNDSIESEPSAKRAALNDSSHNHLATPLSQLNAHDIEEVFHVTGEPVTYDKAEAVCQQLGAKLASYDELLHAYQHGAEWCNYGWSENQTAYYPTQKKTWERIQNADNEEERTMCGVPGLNGGQFDKTTLFNVNCFGKKPTKPEADFVHPKLPDTPEQIEAKKPVEVFNDLVIIPYNRKQWSRNGSEPAQV
tara:strand:- start:24303 stop:25058 length:756 start_codon:yes stop_codon:yes gene_type:complete